MKRGPNARSQSLSVPYVQTIDELWRISRTRDGDVVKVANGATYQKNGDLWMPFEMGEGVLPPLPPGSYGSGEGADLTPYEVANENIPTSPNSWLPEDINNFGTQGNVRNLLELDQIAQYQDVFGTINVGDGKYGCSMIATRPETAVSGQAYDNGTRFREFFPDFLLLKADTLYDGPDLSGTYMDFGSGNGWSGQFTWKKMMSAVGSHLGKDLLWEVKFQEENPLRGRWFALWNPGNKWSWGPEIDMIEAFSGYEGYQYGSWQSNAIFFDGEPGSQDTPYFIPPDTYQWYVGQHYWGLPDGQEDMRLLHRLTYYHGKDNHFEIWLDGYRIQGGTYEWYVPDTGSSLYGQVPNMSRQIDVSLLHLEISDMSDFVIPSASLPYRVRLHHSKLWLRD